VINKKKKLNGSNIDTTRCQLSAPAIRSRYWTVTKLLEVLFVLFMFIQSQVQPCKQYTQ